MREEEFLDEFRADWILEGKAATTVEMYCSYLRQYFQTEPVERTLSSAKSWLSSSRSAETARARARALRAFGAWCVTNEGPAWHWWTKVPLRTVQQTPQATVTFEQYLRTRNETTDARERLLIELLWSTGMRVSELARLERKDVFLADGYVVVRQTKSGEPRLAPLTEHAQRSLRRYRTNHDCDQVLGMSASAIQQLLRRRGLPSPHSWRRGWAAHSLRVGVSQASLQRAAGWRSPAMVLRYTQSQSDLLAIHEFVRVRGADREIQVSPKS
jgi:integrase